MFRSFAVAIVITSCAHGVDLGYNDHLCTRPEQSVYGAVLQTCVADPDSGFAKCRYRVVNVPIDCECREVWIRLDCRSEWDMFRRVCECAGR